MRQLVRVLIIAFISALAMSHVVFAQSVVASRAILVADGQEAPLFSKNATVRHPPASLTKVLTAVIAIESGRLDDKVTISKTAPYAGGSALYVEAGEIYSLRDLLYAALLISANDASAAIAEHLGGSISGFADMMNKRAAELGMNDSHFKNPHGMPVDGHYSTARDMSLLGLHAAKLPLLAEMAAKNHHTLANGKVVYNQNKLLGSHGVLLGKTGYTDEAGQCLLTIAEQSGLTLVSVIMGSQGKAIWSDTTNLLEFGFGNYARRVLIKDKQTIGVTRVPLAGEVLLVSKGEVSTVLKASENLQISKEVRLNKRILPPIKPGQEIGEVIVRNKGAEIARAALTVPIYIPLVTKPRLLAILCSIALLLGVVIFNRRWRSLNRK